MPVPTVRLGRTGAEVPRVSIGTWGHGGTKTVRGRPVGWSGFDEAKAAAALRRAYELGLTHWDTADVYGDGQAETRIGSLWGEIDRDRIFLATKVGWDAGAFDHAYDPQQIRNQMERSLTALRTDYIDLYYFHHCDFGKQDKYLDDALALLQSLRAEGKIRFIGLSDWQSEKVLHYSRRVDPDVVQPYRNVVNDSYDSSGLRAWVDEHDIGVAFFSPLKHGLLLGKHETPPTLEKGDHRSRIPEFSEPEALAHYRHCREEVTIRFSDHSEPVLHALVGALLSDSPTGCVLLGARWPEHAEAAAVIGEALSPEEASWVRVLYREF